MAINPNDITTVRIGELPSNAFNLTDNIAHEVGTDLKRGTVQELIDFITPFIGAIQFQVITLHVDSAYIAANFDPTGLGINLMVGYAICNGNNGTLNKDGRVGIAYGSTYNVIGQFGGSKDAVVVAHTHGFTNTLTGKGSGGVGDFASSASNIPYSDNVATASTGVSGIDKNMQPYLVELHVMRL